MLSSRAHRVRRALSLGLLSVLGAALMLVAPAHADAAPTTAPVDLATAGNTSVVAATSVVVTGPSTLALDVAAPATATVSGVGPGVLAGALHHGDAEATQAAIDLAAADDDVAARVADAA